jgi:predicted nucleic acid-binding protein
MTALVDTNILVYRFDSRFPAKQRLATTVLRDGIEHDSVRIAHQAVVEFVQAVSRPLSKGGTSLLTQPEALDEAEQFLAQYEILFPTASLVRLALRGVSRYRLNWFDAHMWAYAEHYGLEELWSEDFSDGQLLGTVRVRNPFNATDA